ncbi:MAG: hypothetical protein AAF851_21345 [Myxococcota bacterium]
MLGLLILAAQVDPGVAQQLEPQPASPRLELRRGESAFLEHRLEGPWQGFAATSRPNLEVLVERVAGPINVARRGEILSLAQQGAQQVMKVGVVVRSASAQGSAAYRIRVLDRRGIGTPLLERLIRVELSPAPSRWTDEELAYAFHGADQFRSQAQGLLVDLRKRGVRASLKVDEPRPPLLRARDETMRMVQAFEGARRRLGIARRGLLAAARSGNAEAQRLLTLLRQPASKRENAPPIPSSAPPPQASTPTQNATSRTNEEGVLEPIEAYELGSDGRAASPPAAESGPTPAPPAPAPTRPVRAETSSPAPARATESSDRPRPVRGLVLDGADVGFGGGTRFVYAEARLLRSAQTAALFVFAEAAFTENLGLQLDVPIQFLSLQDVEVRDVNTTGNPALSIKYRLWLPKLGGAPIALALRGRYGLPLTPEARFAPTTVVADDFSREVHFVEPHTFLVDRHDFALGASSAWRRGWLSLSAQLWFDYFVPVGSAESLSDFTSLSYGLGVGVLPFSRLDLGSFLEFRGTSVFAGGGRTEGNLYAGLRGRFFGWFEPGAYAGIPLGGLATSSSVQAGLELRFMTPWPKPPIDPRTEDPLQ